MTTHPVAPFRFAGWMPYSPCVVDCVRVDESRVPIPVAVFRLLATCAVMLVVVPLALVHPLLDAPARTAVVRGWCRLLLRALDVRLDVDSPHGPVAAALVVSNHVSWVDVLVLGAVRPGRMLAKADLRSWPLIGTLAARAGTIFLDRTRLSLLPGTVADVRAALRSGARVVAYPEGTTWCGAEGGRFYPAVFQAAIDAGAPVEPVTVRYTAGGHPSTTPAFLGDDSLVASVWRIARARGLVASIRCHPPLSPATRRRDLAAEARRLVHDRPLAAPVHLLHRPRVDRLVGVHQVQVVDGHPA